MTDKYQNKYRVPSARHTYWDYSQNASYFITICTKNREHLFGTIENQMMIKSEMGNYASECWFAIPQHFPFVRLGAFVVMPNHIHGIIIIDKTNDGGTVPSQSNTKSNKFGPQSQNLASVVRGYKIGVTNLARTGRDARFCVSTGTDIPQRNTQSIWQSRYHDHIIRNADEYKRIENYIINNPARWADDKFYSSV